MYAARAIATAKSMRNSFLATRYKGRGWGSRAHGLCRWGTNATLRVLESDARKEDVAALAWQSGRYGVLALGQHTPRHQRAARGAAPPEGTKAILEAQGLIEDAAFGVTKLFLKTPKTLFALETARAGRIPALVTKIQVCVWRAAAAAMGTDHLAEERGVSRALRRDVGALARHAGPPLRNAGPCHLHHLCLLEETPCPQLRGGARETLLGELN